MPDLGVMQLGNIDYVCDTDQCVSQQLVKVGVSCSGGWLFCAFAASAAGMMVNWVHGTTLDEAIRLACCIDYPTINDLTGEQL